MRKKVFSIIVGIMILCVMIVVPVVVFAEGGMSQAIESENYKFMVVFYMKDTEEVLGWSRYSPDMMIDYSGVKNPDFVMEGVDWSEVSYGFYQYQVIKPRYDALGIAVVWSLGELHLTPLSVAEIEGLLNPGAVSKDVGEEIRLLKERVKVLEDKLGVSQ